MTEHILLPYDLELWPTIFTCNPSLAKVKVDFHAKNQGQRSNGADGQTDRWTDVRYYLPCFAVDNQY